MSARHFIGGSIEGDEQQQAQRAHVGVKLPETFEADGRQYVQSWRSRDMSVYLCSNFSDEHEHFYHAYNIRVIGNIEMLGEMLVQTPNLDHAITVATKWESER
jgi:hypothetical protein